MDCEYFSTDDFKTLLPDGEYFAECTGFNTSFFTRKVHKLFLDFEIVMDSNGGHGGEKIFMAFNMPRNGRIGTGSKYYKAWCKVNGQPPSRNAKLSPKLFLNRHYRIRTRTVKRTFEGMVKSESNHYAIVDKIIFATPKITGDD